MLPFSLPPLIITALTLFKMSLILIIPLCIFRLRKEAIKTTILLEQLVELQDGIPYANPDKPTKKCPYCAQMNQGADVICISCGRQIQ